MVVPIECIQASSLAYKPLPQPLPEIMKMDRLMSMSSGIKDGHLPSHILALQKLSYTGDPYREKISHEKKLGGFC